MEASGKAAGVKAVFQLELSDTCGKRRGGGRPPFEEQKRYVEDRRELAGTTALR